MTTLSRSHPIPRVYITPSLLVPLPMLLIEKSLYLKGYLSTISDRKTSTISNGQSRLPIDTTPSNKTFHHANSLLSSHHHHANRITPHANITTPISRHDDSTVVLHETLVDSKYNNHGSTIMDTHSAKKSIEYTQKRISSAVLNF